MGISGAQFYPQPKNQLLANEREVFGFLFIFISVHWQVSDYNKIKYTILVEVTK